MAASMNNTTPNLAPIVPTTGSRTKFSSKFRATKIFERLSRKNANGLTKGIPKESFDRLNEKRSENKSDVSEITDVEYSDGFSSSDDGKSTGKQCSEDNINLKEPKQPQPSISNSTDASFPQCLGTWFDSLSYLAKSKEMDSFLHSSNKLALSAAYSSMESARNVGEIAVNVALLPIIFPLQVTASATDLVFNKGSNALHYFCDNLVPIAINHSIKIPTSRIITTAVDIDNHSRLRSEKTSIAKTCTVKSTEAKSIKHELENWQFNYDPEKFLDRFRLDSNIEHNNTEDDSHPVDAETLPIEQNISMSCSSNYSKFQLRVDDVNISVKEDPDLGSDIRIYCVDLEIKFSYEGIIFDALTQLAQRGIHICLSNKFLLKMYDEKNQKQIEVDDNSIRIDWKPLGQTKKDYIRLGKLTKKEYYDELCGRVCIWAGNYLGDKYHGSENPFLMAQGCVNGSPTKILNLLWDSNRVNEYNKHCVNRNDILTIVEDSETVINGAFWGAKIIKSETKVPFTNVGVHLCALMCVKLLGDRPKDGFIIFSRSLSHGPKGHRTSKKEGLCQSSNNEVILGINIIRPVPNYPDLSELISISQVDSSILPQFLKSRVGIIAIEDFFKNVRLALK